MGRLKVLVVSSIYPYELVHYWCFYALKNSYKSSAAVPKASLVLMLAIGAIICGGLC